MDDTHPQQHIDRLLARSTACGRRRRDLDEDDMELARQERAGTESQEVGADDDYA